MMQDIETLKLSTSQPEVNSAMGQCFGNRPPDRRT